MKSLTLITLILGFFVVSCKREPQIQPKHIDSFNTRDSMITDTAQITPDSGDNTLQMESKTYSVDSIKNNK